MGSSAAGLNAGCASPARKKPPNSLCAGTRPTAGRHDRRPGARAEDGIPQRVKSAYLSDDDIIALADHAAQLRQPPDLTVVQDGEAA